MIVHLVKPKCFLQDEEGLLVLPLVVVIKSSALQILKGPLVLQNLPNIFLNINLS